MSKVELGDIFEIKTNKGMAYFQCVKIDKLRWYTIKVFNQLYYERPTSVENIVKVKDNYLIGFPVSAAHRRKLVEKVGNMPLPDDFALPKYMRDKHVIRGEFLGWHIVEVNSLKRQLVKELSPEQKKLSPLGTCNDTLLKEMLEHGWNLENW